MPDLQSFYRGVIYNNLNREQGVKFPDVFFLAPIDKKLEFIQQLAGIQHNSQKKKHVIGLNLQESPKLAAEIDIQDPLLLSLDQYQKNTIESLLTTNGGKQLPYASLLSFMSLQASAHFTPEFQTARDNNTVLPIQYQKEMAGIWPVEALQMFYQNLERYNAVVESAQALRQDVLRKYNVAPEHITFHPDIPQVNARDLALRLNKRADMAPHNAVSTHEWETHIATPQPFCMAGEIKGVMYAQTSRYMWNYDILSPGVALESALGEVVQSLQLPQYNLPATAVYNECPTNQTLLTVWAEDLLPAALFNRTYFDRVMNDVMPPYIAYPVDAEIIKNAPSQYPVGLAELESLPNEVQEAQAWCRSSFADIQQVDETVTRSITQSLRECKDDAARLALVTIDVYGNGR